MNKADDGAVYQLWERVASEPCSCGHSWASHMTLEQAIRGLSAGNYSYDIITDEAFACTHCECAGWLERGQETMP